MQRVRSGANVKEGWQLQGSWRRGIVLQEPSKVRKGSSRKLPFITVW